MKRRVTPEAQARADRIAAALSGLLDDDAELDAADTASAPDRDPYRPVPVARSGTKKARPELACPACEGGLVLHYARGAQIHRCQQCGAFWLSHGDIESMVEPGEQASAGVDDIRRRVAASHPGLGDPVRYRGCPSCSVPMNRRNFADVSGVIVDECPRHGIFLDPGEFEAIETFIHLGGLQAQRRAADERKRIAKARAARAKVAQSITPPLPQWSRARYWWDIFF
ncbi:MAG: zf-TFIIB domain-containing protein [Myxococcota bacterium]